MSTPLFALDSWAGDPMHPGTDTPTPVELVAELTWNQRKQRVRVLIEQAHQILADALEAHTDRHTIVGTCLLWSGGNDSNVLAHLMRPVATHAVHANTGIGIEETRQFVRATAAAWSLPLLERHPPAGSDYRSYVLEHGFPGPAQHFRMYQRLKERALRQVRRELVTRPHRQRVVFLAGRRRAESKRRVRVPLYERDRSVIWVSPLALWTTLDLNTYRHLHPDTPRNQVSDLLHMSGECLCGSFAEVDELEQIRQWFPDTAARIDALAVEARANGIPEERCRWGWGAYRPANRPRPDRRRKAGPLCSSCTEPTLWQQAAS